MTVKNLIICFTLTLSYLFINAQPIDKNVTKETLETYQLLANISGKNVLYGQQEATMRRYGYKKRYGCDVKDVCGSYPAIYGWDLGWMHEHGNYLAKHITKAYNRGGISTASFHMDNLLTGKGCQDTTQIVNKLIPGGSLNENYKQVLDNVANFCFSLKGKNGELIPLIFRPFHEHTGKWFWWGQTHCTKQEFIDLWQYTVTYLRDEKGVHNLLYAYSPDTIANEEQYMERYPGDDYVDVMGIDIYRDVEANNSSKFVNRIKIVTSLAEKHKKISALTETGYSKHDEKDWWTKFLLHPIKSDPQASKISYLLIWANYHEDAFFSIFKGHFNEADFVKMRKDGFLLFEEDLEKVRKDILKD